MIDHGDELSDAPGGARVRHLTRDGDLGRFADALMRHVEAERDSYREIAIAKQLALRAARSDVEA